MKGTMVLVIAIVVGALAAVLAKSQIESEISDRTENLEPTWVAVAARNLEAGQNINVDNDIEFRQYPKELAFIKGYVPKNQVREIDNIKIRVDITKGKLIDRYYLGHIEAVNKGPKDVTTSGQKTRLIPIKVNEISGIAGYLKTGDRVDVLHTNNDKRTQMVLQNVNIRYVGRSGMNQSGRRSAYSSITVEVRPREAMVLTNAMETGTIMLIKRGRTDLERVPQSQVQPVSPTGDYNKVLNEGN